MSQRDLANGAQTSLAGLSNAAKAFLKAGPTSFRGKYQVEGIEQLRSRLREEGDAACRRALLRHGASTRDVIMGGIRCMEVAAPPVGHAAVFFCFGGGMITGSPFEELVITAALARYTGATVIVPYYRLAPEHPFPAAPDDIHAAYCAAIARFGRANMSVAGESAGGNLALALLQRLEPAERPAAVALISPWCDLSHRGESLKFNARLDPTISTYDLRRAAKAYCGRKRRTDPRLSPLFADSFRGIPPTMITTGTYDLLLSDSLRLAEKLQAEGVSINLRIWEALWHAFEFYEGVPEGDASLIEIGTFLRSGLSAASLRD